MLLLRGEHALFYEKMLSAMCRTEVSVIIINIFDLVIKPFVL